MIRFDYLIQPIRELPRNKLQEERENVKATLQIKFGALRDLVPFVQFKNREKHQWRSVTFSKMFKNTKKLKY